MFSGSDDRYGLPGRFAVARCTNCGHAQIVDGPAEDELGELYGSRYPRADCLRSYKPFAPRGPFRSWLEGAKSAAALWVPPGCRVIEVGCGGCQMLGYLRGLGCDVTGVEVDANVLALAAQEGFDVRIGRYRPGDFPVAGIDIGLLNQVLEHLVDPGALLADMRSNLRPNGRVIVTLPNAAGPLRRLFGKRWLHWHLPYHRHFFSRTSLAFLAQQAGYSIVTLRTITPSSWAQYQWCHLFPAAVPGQPHPFWNERLPRTFLQRLYWRAVTLLLHGTYLDHLAYRLLDALGLGDNLVVILEKK
jgi:SAM-dependent methyltransferase